MKDIRERQRVKKTARLKEFFQSAMRALSLIAVRDPTPTGVPVTGKSAPAPRSLHVFGLDVLLIVSLKGGCGKTTAATNLAVAAYAQGCSVLILDADVRQRSALKWGERRKKAPFVRALRSARDLPAALQAAKAEGFDLVIIDTAGNEDSALLADYATLAIVPTTAQCIDVEGAAITLKMLAARGVPHVAAIFGQKSLNSASAVAFRAALSEICRVLPTAVADLTAFGFATDHGRSVVELSAPHHAGVRAQILDLYQDIEAILEKKRAKKTAKRRAPVEPFPPLAELLARNDRRADALLQWSIRPDPAVGNEIAQIARQLGCSINVLTLMLYDDLLVRHGRPRISELAPEFARRLQRSGRGGRRGDDEAAA